MGLIVTLEHSIESFRCRSDCHVVFCLKREGEEWYLAGLKMFSDTSESNIAAGLRKIFAKEGIVDNATCVALIESALSDFRRFTELPTYDDIFTPEDFSSGEGHEESHTVH